MGMKHNYSCGSLAAAEQLEALMRHAAPPFTHEPTPEKNCNKLTVELLIHIQHCQQCLHVTVYRYYIANSDKALASS